MSRPILSARSCPSSGSGESGPPEPIEAVVLAIEEMPDLLHHRGGVAARHGMLAVPDEFLEEVLGVGQVEVPGEDEGARRPVAVSGAGVATAGGVVPGRAVPNVAQVQLGRELLQRGWGGVAPTCSGDHRRSAPVGSRAVAERSEDRIDRIAPRGSLDVIDGLPHLGIELDAGDARPVLTSVSLLLQQEVHPREAPRGRAVALPEIRRGAKEAHQRHATVMTDLVTHRPSL
jgi:hypothetical protein